MTEDQRITKLEEAVAFNERTIDDLSAELAKAYERIDTLVRRIETLDSRIADLEQDDTTIDEEDHDPVLERPPHSAGPRD